MSSILIQTAMNLMEYWILIFLMKYVCSAHINLSRINMIICSCIAIFGTIIAFLFSGPYNMLCNMVIIITLTVLLFSQKRLSDLLRFFPAFSIYFTLTVAPEGMLEELIPKPHVTFVFQDYSLTLISIITDVVLLIFLIILRYLLTKYRTTLHFSAKEVFGSIALLFFSFIDVALIMLLNRSNLKPISYYGYMTIFLGGFVFSVGYYLYSLFESRIRIYRQSIARSETQYLQLQLDSLQDVKENEEHVRRMRHDLASHLAIIKSLCEEGNYEEVRKYTEQLSDNAIPSNNRILTDNKVADLVVGSKMKVCEEHGITFTFEGSLKNLKVMTAPDICGLFANAYDNAIEACLPQSEAYIHTKVSTTRNYTVIQIINSVEKRVTIRSNSAATTKKDKKAHGYGIDIMKGIAHKYNGSCTLRCDDHEFEVKIVLLT